MVGTDGDDGMLQTCEPSILTKRQPSGVAGGSSGWGCDAAYHGVLLSACTAAIAGAFVLGPDEQGLSLLGYRWPFYCWLHETLGIKCALCGLSRSFCSLAHGNISASFGFHRLGPVVFVLFCLEIPYRLPGVLRHGERIPRGLTRIHFLAISVVGAAVVVNWLGYLGGLIL